MADAVLTPHQVFNAAKRALSFSFEQKTNLCDPFLMVIPVSGAAISFFGSAQSNVVISASDHTAASIDELQIDLGEGPGWEALALGRPSLHSDLSQESLSAWPVFAEEIKDLGIGALYAFPLAVSSLNIGAVDFYNSSPRELTSTQIADGVALARIAAWQVLRSVLADEEEQLHTPARYSRREIHQATGMVIAQLEISAEDATLLLRAHAFSSGVSVRQIAGDVVARKLIFSHDIGKNAGPNAG